MLFSDTLDFFLIIIIITINSGETRVLVGVVVESIMKRALLKAMRWCLEEEETKPRVLKGKLISKSEI